MKILNIFIKIINITIILIVIISFNDNSFSSIKKRNKLLNEFNMIYSDLFYAAKSGLALKPQLNENYTEKIYSINNKKGICLCIVGKNENLYAKEYIEYYRYLGFKKIIIFDNNEINSESFYNVLKDYVLNNFVEIIDAKGMKSIQIAAYNYCYKINKNLFDWIAFFDFDEFLYLKNDKNIENYLYDPKFNKCESIIFNWHIYDDNDLEKYDKRELIKRFTKVKLKSTRAKSIVRGNLNNILLPSVHVLGININYFCDSNGNRIIPFSYLDINYNESNIAYIKHFYTKTVEEFCVKLNRGGGQNLKEKIILDRLQLFFQINKITRSKIKTLEKCTNINLSYFINKSLSLN